jgi:hypothetical protein
MKKKNITVKYISIIEPKGEEAYVAITEIEFDNHLDAKAFIEGLPKDRILTEVSQLPDGGNNTNTEDIDIDIMLNEL